MFLVFLLFESFDIHRMCPDVGKQLVEARLQPEAWRQQAEARSAKLSKRVLSCFCLILKNSLSLCLSVFK